MRPFIEEGRRAFIETLSVEEHCEWLAFMGWLTQCWSTSWGRLAQVDMARNDMVEIQYKSAYKISRKFCGCTLYAHPLIVYTPPPPPQASRSMVILTGHGRVVLWSQATLF
jgi:hypothetical protein